MTIPSSSTARITLLGQVVIGPDLKTDDAVHFISPGGQPPHRDIRIGSYLATNLKAVEVGRHHIENHGVEAILEHFRVKLIGSLVA